LAVRPSGSVGKGFEAVLSYLSRYTHRIAISNRRLVSADQHLVAIRYKDYRADHSERWKTMRLTTNEFIRRFLSHVLPKGLHRIRHYGLLAKGNRAANIAKARQLLDAHPPQDHLDTSEPTSPDEPKILPQPCQYCGGRMIVIETFDAGCKPKCAPSVPGIDSS
jgi:hypothetical protein